ncbi:MAG: DUF177 domain-containing protein [Gemmatimonadota bacterium]|jgi:uncharacterized protein
MLRVDLGRLEREKRLRIDASIPVDDPRWEEIGVRLAGPLEIGLDVTATGHDVLVRGRFRGEAAGECRRCLRPTRAPIESELTLLFRPGVAAVEAEAQEVYPLPERERDLDLWPALREHLILAQPEYMECRPECRGLCARCGADLNEGPCGCGEPEPDARWARLRRLKF